MLVLIIMSYIQVYKIYGGKDPSYDYIDAYKGACEGESNSLVDYCNIDISNLPSTPDTYTIFFSIIRSDILYHLPMYGILLIIVFSLSFINKILKSKYLYYYVQRKEYKSFLKSILLYSYKYVLVIPFMIGLIYLITVQTH